jgi:hypothetical protein
MPSEIDPILFPEGILVQKSHICILITIGKYGFDGISPLKHPAKVEKSQSGSHI